MNKNKTIYISAAAAIILFIVLIILLTTGTEDTVLSNRKTADKNLLVGDWLRTDASYTIKITKVNEDGTLSAQL